MFQSSEVKLTFVKGEFWEFDENKLALEKTNINKCNALLLKSPHDYLGSNYLKLFLPCIPAYSLSTEFFDKESKSIFDLPNELPIGIKVNDSIQNNFTGFASGRRSAIILQENKLFRLKGCGNDSEGFVLQSGVSLDPESKELRGCHYRHTVFRELYMTNKISKILSIQGFETGNKGIGAFRYSEQGMEELGIQNKCPNVEKFVGVFSTLSDRRLFTHLIQGCDMLNSFVIHKFNELQGKRNYFIFRGLSGQLKEERRKDLLSNPLDFDAISSPCEIKDIELDHLETYFQDSDKENLINLATSSIVNENGEDFLDFKSLCEYLINSKEFNEKYKTENSVHSQFNSNLIKELNSTEDSISYFKILSHLISRIGWELGRIKRILLDAKINWGCYRDHHPYIQHNNAHPNNFVVLEGGAGHNNLLAPIDFDLSFDEEEFISIDSQSEGYGTQDKSFFNQLLKEELFYFEQSISGVENMLNFKYSGEQGEEEKDKETLIIEALMKVAIRDSLKISMIDGYKGEKFLAFSNLPQYNSLHTLVKVCMALTSKCSS